jgi:ABC-type lipoprotein release transport system permease subunit
MLKNHIVIALRNLTKNRVFSVLNIGGLSAGLAVAMLIGLYIRDEFAFDRFNEKADRIYRINYDARVGGQEQQMADFAYRIDLHWWMFAVAGVAAAGIAFLTVAGQAVRAALVNPVRSLRNE